MDDKIQQVTATFHAVGVDFIRTELDTAVILCETALVSRDPAHAERDVNHARKALGVVARFTERIRLNGTERQEVAEKTSRVVELIEELVERQSAQSE